MSKKTCLHCKNSNQVFKDSFIFGQPHMQPYIECNLHSEISEIGEKHKWNEKVMPEICGKFEPKMVERCGYCHSPINVPEYQWDMWAGANNTPVCSKDCQAKKEAQEIATWFTD